MGPPRFGKDYKWYISGIFPANWGIICHRSHLLGEPETTIDLLIVMSGNSSVPFGCMFFRGLEDLDVMSLEGKKYECI